MMSFFLNWFTSHIAPVIQVLAGLIICLLLIFAYRLFFVKPEKSDSIGSESNPTLDFIEEKLNKLLIQQSALKVTATSMAASGDISSEHIGEISRLKEILSEKEKEILNLRNLSPLVGSSSVDAASQSSSNQTDQTDDQTAQEIKKLNDLLSLYQTQIDDLKSRLSDYEIIAEDIADLQKFKKENELLRDQLSNAGKAAQATKEEPVLDTILTDEEKSLHLADDNSNLNALLSEASADKAAETMEVAAAAAESPVATESPKESPDKPASINAKQDEIDSLFAEFSPDAATKEEKSVVTEEVIDTALTENEKNLLDDFSKTEKG